MTTSFHRAPQRVRRLTGATSAPQCKESVWHNMIPSRCARNAGESGYCWQHEPGNVKAKREAARRKWQGNYELQKRRHEVQERRLAFLDLFLKSGLGHDELTTEAWAIIKAEEEL